MAKGRLFDRVYFRKSRLLEAEVDSIGFAEGQYQICCKVPGEKHSVEMTVSESVIRRIQRKNILALICYEFPKGRVYSVASLSEMPASVQLSELKSEASGNSQELDEKATMLHKANLATLILAFLSCPASPFASMLLSFFSIILALFVVPFKSWTMQRDFGIIKDTKDHSGKGQAPKESDLPVGYADWSQTNKELFAIEQRLQNSLKELSVGDEESALEKPELSPEKAEPEKMPPQDEAPPQKICTNCGCIVDASARFCSSCGHPLIEGETPAMPIIKDEEAPVKTKEAAETIPETVEEPEPIFEETAKETVKEAVVVVEEKKQEKKPARYGSSKPRRKPRNAPDDEVAAMVDSIANQH